MTDQRSQEKQFSDVLVSLKGVHSSGTATSVTGHTLALKWCTRRERND
jgi:hypothetical protein